MTADRPPAAPGLLAVYLRDHAAAARAGVDLFRRAAASQAGRPWGAELSALATEVAEDCSALQELLRSLDVRPASLTTLVVRAGERVGRLKPNGSLVRRSPLSDLVEVEAGLDAVHAKAGGWQALRAAGVSSEAVDLERLAARAEDQLVRLQRIHAVVAERVLGRA